LVPGAQHEGSRRRHFQPKLKRAFFEVVFVSNNEATEL
jgi:hypothetical protein